MNNRKVIIEVVSILQAIELAKSVPDGTVIRIVADPNEVPVRVGREMTDNEIAQHFGWSNAHDMLSMSGTPIDFFDNVRNLIIAARALRGNP